MSGNPGSDAPFAELLGEVVVVDTKSTFFYIGTLKAASPHVLVLADVDVHDHAETRSTRELYIMETKKYGLKSNRREAHVRADEVVSLSRLDDIITY